VSKPLVSCVVPAFNSGRYIGEALDSILAQTYSNIEIIVSDDGSTDDTASVVARRGEHIRYLKQETAGPAATRNLGTAASKGELLAFLDADDLWHEQKLERQLDRFHSRPELEACVTHAQMFWIPGLEQEAEEYRENPRSEAVPGYATTTLLAKRSVFERVGSFRTDLWFSDATDWFMRARESGVVIELMPDVLTYHRMHERNLTRRRSEASKVEFARVVGESLIRRRAAGAELKKQ
jgi:glycosyltransferase involved in cell wall biosynthesis